MKVFARGDNLYIRDEHGDTIPIKKVFKDFHYDNARKSWYTKASIASFLDIMSVYPNAIPETDEETVKWRNKCRAEPRQ